jgi:hypothetical protein
VTPYGAKLVGFSGHPGNVEYRKNCNDLQLASGQQKFFDHYRDRQTRRQFRRSGPDQTISPNQSLNVATFKAERTRRKGHALRAIRFPGGEDEQRPNPFISSMFGRPGNACARQIPRLRSRSVELGASEDADREAISHACVLLRDACPFPPVLSPPLRLRSIDFSMCS